jgi:RNA polymerase sigma factor (sigma-70 family)
MTRRVIGLLLDNLRKSPGHSALSDAALLRRFADHRDEAAFRELVERFGPMVLGVCRRVLGDVHAAEDAFQATFLVLARKAPSLVHQELVGNWLWGAALRTARRARADAARWSSRQREAHTDMAPDPVDEVMWRDLRPVLDEEIGRLPPRCRQAFVLCYLEGKTNAEAARRLGCPPGTVFTRLADAREILRRRLTRRGVTLSAVAFGVALTWQATARVPAALARSTAQAATLFAAGGAGAVGKICPYAAGLAEGVLRAAFVNKLKLAVVALFSVAALGSVGTLYTRSLQADAVKLTEYADRRPPVTLAQAPEARHAEPPSELSGNAAPKPLEGDRAKTDHAEAEGGFGFGMGVGLATATINVNTGNRSLSVTVYGSDKLVALLLPAVQRDLALTREQLEQVGKLQARQQHVLERLAPYRPVNVRQAREILREVERAPRKVRELTREIDTAIDELLTEKQRSRLRQITPAHQREPAVDDRTFRKP